MAFITAVAVFPLSEAKSQTLECLQNNCYRKEHPTATPTPQEHRSNINANAFSPWTGLRNLSSKLEFSYRVPSSRRGRLLGSLYMETQWMQTPILGSCLERIWSQPLNHGLSCCDRTQMFAALDQICSFFTKNPPALEEFFHTEGCPTCLTSGGTRDQFSLLLGTALSQFISLS